MQKHRDIIQRLYTEGNRLNGNFEIPESWKPWLFFIKFFLQVIVTILDDEAEQQARTIIKAIKTYNKNL